MQLFSLHLLAPTPPQPAVPRPSFGQRCHGRHCNLPSQKMAATDSGKSAAGLTTRNAQGVQTIKVSAARSVFFFVDLATKYLKDEPQIELSGLGYGSFSSLIFGGIPPAAHLRFLFLPLPSNHHSRYHWRDIEEPGNR